MHSYSCFFLSDSLVKANFQRNTFKHGLGYFTGFQTRSQRRALYQELNRTALQKDISNIHIWLWNKISQFTVSSCCKISRDLLPINY